MQFGSSGQDSPCLYILNLQVEKLHKLQSGSENLPSFERQGKGSAAFSPKKSSAEKPGSKEPLRTEDLFLSLAESLAKTDLYDLFMTQILSLDVCV